MIRGLVIGKFMPVHQGHIALINFASRQCDELIVSMSYTVNDPIPAELRFSWIKDIFKDRPAIILAMVKDDFDNESLSIQERTKTWSEFIRKTYSPVSIIFSSEEYGEPFAQNLGAIHKLYDLARKMYPISSSRIRQKPFQCWDFIPSVVRPYFVSKICFYGPESTGKTTMAMRMADRYKTEFVPEVARELITSNDFTIEDIKKIGLAHFQRIEDKSKTANKILICDTDAITTQIYSRQYLNQVPEELYILEKKVKYALYFLMDIDIPWVSDGLRDLGHHREAMMTVFKDELIRRDIPYIFVRGTDQQREENISSEIDRLLN